MKNDHSHFNRSTQTEHNRMNTHAFQRLAAALQAGLIPLVLGLACFGSFTHVLAQTTANPPERLTYQGYLTDSDGAPLGGTNGGPKNYDVIFRIYNAQTAGDLLWGEQQTVTVDKGYFSVLLGEGADSGDPRPDLSALFAGPTASDRYVGIFVKDIGAPGENVPILPRLRLLTSPYAFLARNASALVSPNGSNVVSAANGTLTVNGTLSATTINGSGLTGLTPGQIPNLDGSKITGNLDASKITGTISDARLSGSVARRDVANTFNASQTIAGVSGYNGLKITGSSTLSGMIIENTAAGGHQYVMFAQSDGRFQINDHTPFPQQRVTIVGTGNVGIGTESPAAKLDVRGDVKLGPSGQYYAPAGEENLRIVRGSVSALGAKVNGSGFTSIKEAGTGAYRITFDPAFPAGEIPTVTANSLGNADNNVSIPVVTNSYFLISIRVPTAANANTPFNFIAIGTR